jgi:predicted deacylase
MIAGTHGDEYEGQLISIELAQGIDAAELTGRLIVLPMLNLPACHAGHRHSPIDARDLNRTYPGRADGTISEVLANFVASTLLPQADFVIDVHSGGWESQYVPCAMMMSSGKKELDADMFAAVESFGAPFGIVFQETDNPGSMRTKGTLEDTAHKRGIAAISTELGGGGFLTSDTLAVGRRGIRNLITYLGLTRNYADNKSDCRMMECIDASQYIVATDNGLWEPLVQLGDPVKIGTPMCRLFSTSDLMQAPEILFSQSAGVVIAKRVPARCRRNEFLLITARDK